MRRELSGCRRAGTASAQGARTDPPIRDATEQMTRDRPLRSFVDCGSSGKNRRVKVVYRVMKCAYVPLTVRSNDDKPEPFRRSPQRTDEVLLCLSPACATAAVPFNTVWNCGAIFVGQEATGGQLRRPLRATAAQPLATAYDCDTTWSDTPDCSCDRVTYSLWCCGRATGAPTVRAPVACRSLCHVTPFHAIRKGTGTTRRCGGMHPSRPVARDALGPDPTHRTL